MMSMSFSIRSFVCMDNMMRRYCIKQIYAYEVVIVYLVQLYLVHELPHLHCSLDFFVDALVELFYPVFGNRPSPAKGSDIHR